MKKIIVFGATGDTGRYFIDYLYNNVDRNEFEIVATGTRETNCFDKYRIAYYKVDISKKQDFEVLPKEAYAVVDLAGYMPARMRGYDPEKYIDVNINGTLNVLNYCLNAKVDRILFAQSFGDIKDNAEKNPLLTVDVNPNFKFNTDHTVYIMTKNFAVDLIKNYNAVYGLKAFVFRLPTIYLWSRNDKYYVDGQERTIGYRLLINKATKGEPIEVWGNPCRVKDMVYVKDFCQMLFKALFVKDVSFGHYNVGTGKGVSLEDQIKGIIDVFSKNKKSEITYRPDMPDAPQYIMDITPAVEQLGYAPKYDYISMLKDMKKEMEDERFN